MRIDDREAVVPDDSGGVAVRIDGAGASGGTALTLYGTGNVATGNGRH